MERNITAGTSIQQIQGTGGADALPSVGKKEILVVPVEFSDFPFQDGLFSKLDLLFNGNATDGTTGYWESVCSFYKKSSYGKLDMHMTIADIYKPVYAKTGKQYVTSNITSYVDTLDILRLAVANYKETTSTDCKQFDSDSNGFIDSVYLVYSAPDYLELPTLNHDAFWAFTYWDYTQTANKENPIGNSYFWVSVDFMDEKGKGIVDAHTFIHETGHLLGAEDYYNYRGTSQPLGGLDMMDYNIGDHNLWTKMEYGWVDPIVVTGNAKVTIKTSQLAGDVILLAPDGWNNTPFDEMITLEMYSPTGLNLLDATSPYQGVFPLQYTKPGIKALHADSRLMDSEFHYRTTTAIGEDSDHIYFAACNTDDYTSTQEGRNHSPENFYQLGLLQAGKKATCLSQNSISTDGDLFQAGQAFNMEDYPEFFKSYPTLDNGKTLPYEFYVESMDADQATIVIQRV